MAGKEKVKLIIDLKDATDPLFVPGNLKLNNKAASFNRTWNRDGRRITLESDLDVPAAVIPANEYRGFRELYSEASDTKGSTLLFQR